MIFIVSILRDHANGNPELIKNLARNIPVYGGDDRIPSMTNKIGQDDTFKIGTLDVKCLFTPCHTTGHICYFVKSPVEGVAPAVFTGDTLFIAGCGKFFEGNATQMYDALLNKLAKLPENTVSTLIVKLNQFIKKLNFKT